MARDNSPKERQRQQLERKASRRAPYDRILIVSEGSRTEPNYFKEIREEYRLHTANVEVQPSGFGTAPIQVVKYARDLFTSGDRHKHIPPRAFERVYAVFDRDEHESYFNALSLAESLDSKLRNDLRQPVRFLAVASVPCFELWLLLHFEDIKSPLHRDEVLRRLKGHLPEYEKGVRGSFAMTKTRIELASERAHLLIATHSAHDAPEPFTLVGELVALLTTLRA
jgi:hypothetical protein